MLMITLFVPAKPKQPGHPLNDRMKILYYAKICSHNHIIYMLKNKVYTMTSDMKNLIEQPAWLALSQHYQDTAAKHMRDAFADESNRFERFSVKHGEILL